MRNLIAVDISTLTVPSNLRARRNHCTSTLMSRASPALPVPARTRRDLDTRPQETQACLPLLLIQTDTRAFRARAP